MKFIAIKVSAFTSLQEKIDNAFTVEVVGETARTFKVELPSGEVISVRKSNGEAWLMEKYMLRFRTEKDYADWVKQMTSFEQRRAAREAALADVFTR